MSCSGDVFYEFECQSLCDCYSKAKQLALRSWLNKMSDPALVVDWYSDIIVATNRFDIQKFGNNAHLDNKDIHQDREKYDRLKQDLKLKGVSADEVWLDIRDKSYKVFGYAKIIEQSGLWLAVNAELLDIREHDR